jgi:hypothetical protein
VSKNKSILATVITVIGGIVVALISNADKITLNFTNVINKYALIPGIILFTIWLIYILTNKFKLVRVENHPIFTQFIYWNHYVESVFELENKGKELVFRELLQGNLNIYKDRLCKLHDDTKNIHNIVEFKSKHLHIFYGILHELENYFSEKNYSKSEMEVLNLVIPKYNK